MNEQFVKHSEVSQLRPPFGGPIRPAL